jgi:predicted amidophosphoribosyltransferase
VGEALEIELADPQTLVNTSTRLADIARKSGCLALTGASSVGNRLAAATVALAQDGLHLWRPGETEPVLVIDGLLATGANLSSVAWHLRREGVERTVAAAVIKAGDPEIASDISELVVLEA